MRNNTASVFIIHFLKVTSMTRIHVMKCFAASVIFALIGVSIPCATYAETISNEDVIQLTKAGMTDAVIVEAIAQSENKFDTSTAALIKLKNSGVSNAVIAKVLSASAPINSTNRNTPPTPQYANNCKVVSIGSIAAKMGDKYLSIDFKNAARENNSSGVARGATSILTLGIVKFRKVDSYAVLSGEKANVRFISNAVAFDDIAIEPGMEPNDAIKLVSLEKGRINNTSGRFLRVSPEESVRHIPLTNWSMPLEFERVQNECIINGRTVNVWRAKPKTPLSPGEYAIQVEPNRYYDFAIEAAPEVATAPEAQTPK